MLQYFLNGSLWQKYTQKDDLLSANLRFQELVFRPQGLQLQNKNTQIAVGDE